MRCYHSSEEVNCEQEDPSRSGRLLHSRVSHCVQSISERCVGDTWLPPLRQNLPAATLDVWQPTPGAANPASNLGHHKYPVFTRTDPLMLAVDRPNSRMLAVDRALFSNGSINIRRISQLTSRVYSAPTVLRSINLLAHLARLENEARLRFPIRRDSPYRFLAPLPNGTDGSFTQVNIAFSVMGRWLALPRGKQVVEPCKDGASKAAVDQTIPDSRQGVREAVTAMKTGVNGTEKSEKCRPV